MMSDKNVNRPDWKKDCWHCKCFLEDEIFIVSIWDTTRKIVREHPTHTQLLLIIPICVYEIKSAAYYKCYLHFKLSRVKKVYSKSFNRKIRVT